MTKLWTLTCFVAVDLRYDSYTGRWLTELIVLSMLSQHLVTGMILWLISSKIYILCCINFFWAFICIGDGGCCGDVVWWRWCCDKAQAGSAGLALVSSAASWQIGYGRYIVYRGSVWLGVPGYEIWVEMEMEVTEEHAYHILLFHCIPYSTSWLTLCIREHLWWPKYWRADLTGLWDRMGAWWAWDTGSEDLVARSSFRRLSLLFMLVLCNLM